VTLHSKLMNGSATILGRGLARRKITFDEKANLAADAVTGVRPYQPSIEQASLIFQVPRHIVSERVRLRTGGGKRRKAANGNGHGDPYAFVRDDEIRTTISDLDLVYDDLLGRALRGDNVVYGHAQTIKAATDLLVSIRDRQNSL
jgi:hypothetical protein